MIKISFFYSKISLLQLILIVQLLRCFECISTWKLTSLRTNKWVRVVTREAVAWDLSTHPRNYHWNVVAACVGSNFWINSTDVVSTNHALLVRHVGVVLVDNQFSSILHVLTNKLLISCILLKLLLIEILHLAKIVGIHVLLLTHVLMGKVNQIYWVLHYVLWTSELVVGWIGWFSLSWLLLNNDNLLSISNLTAVYKNWLLFLSSFARKWNWWKILTWWNVWVCLSKLIQMWRSALIALIVLESSSTFVAAYGTHVITFPANLSHSINIYIFSQKLLERSK